MHLAVWERGIVALLNRQDRREAMGLDAATWEGHDIDIINGAIRDQYIDLPWQDVIREFNLIHEALVNTLDGLSDSDIHSPYRTFATETDNDTPVSEYIVGNTYEHYDEHLPWMSAIAGDESSGAPKTTADLLARIESGWAAFQSYLGTLTPEQMTGPTDAAGWTAKDHVAHIALWERGVSEALAGQNRREVMDVDEATWNTRDYTLINEVLRQQVAGWSLDQVRQQADAIHAEFVARIARLSDSDLTRPYSDFEQGSSNQTPIIAYLMGDTYKHYEEHAPWIEAIVSKP